MVGKPERIRDPVHDLIEFDTSGFQQTCWEVIQTRPFQRLRRVKQLGFSELVYPSATHSRFSHSVGVFHVARQLASVIARIRAEGYDARRGQEAMAAALVHDLGHGPFSHAFEEVLKSLGLGKHEARSVELIEKTEVAEVLEKFAPGFSKNVAEIVRRKVPDDMHAAIVASQFDADRLDYMRRDRLMTGTQGSGIDFDWLLANLDVRRVNIGQDETKIREVETLVVGHKAVLAAEAYVLSLFHLYPTVYCHKTTRSAEKMFTALLTRVFTLALDGGVKRTGLPDNHPILRFAKKPTDLDCFCDLDDSSVWGAMSLLIGSEDGCLRELSFRLSRRDELYKAIDVSGLIEAHLSNIDSEAERRDKRKELEAKIRDRVKDAKMLEFSESAPRVLQDVVFRDPYRQGQGEEAALEMIYGIDRGGNLRELSELSAVVRALRPFEAYRLYYRRDDAETKAALDDLIKGVCA